MLLGENVVRGYVIRGNIVRGIVVRGTGTVPFKQKQQTNVKIVIS
jgi:hypothetical protein